MAQQGSYWKTYVMRNVTAGIVGLVAAMATVFALHWSTDRFLYPSPAGVSNSIAIAAWMAAMPTWVAALFIAGSAVAGFVGAGISSRLATLGRLPIALAIGVLMTAAMYLGTKDMGDLGWVGNATLGAFIPGSFAGWWLLRPKKRK